MTLNSIYVYVYVVYGCVNTKGKVCTFEMFVFVLKVGMLYYVLVIQYLYINVVCRYGICMH